MSQANDLIIVGSGPAGLSAAIYAKRAGLSVIVLEKTGIAGGQILSTYEVDNYPGLPGVSGFDLGDSFRRHAEKLGVSIQEAEVTGVLDQGDMKMVMADTGNYIGRAVIIATGAHNALLGVPGEEELTGMGVSYCATCDGAFFRGRQVAVIGGGDVAVEDAIFLARTCEKVTLIHRRDSLRAAKLLQENLQKLSNVEIIWDTTVEEIQGEEQVECLLLKNQKTGEESKLQVAGVFIAVGTVPDTDMVKGVVEMDEKGYIVAGEACETNVPGIFVAGDVRTKQLRQVITAAADGANAITSLEKYFLTKL